MAFVLYNNLRSVVIADEHSYAYRQGESPGVVRLTRGRCRRPIISWPHILERMSRGQGYVGMVASAKIDQALQFLDVWQPPIPLAALVAETAVSSVVCYVLQVVGKIQSFCPVFSTKTVGVLQPD